MVDDEEYNHYFYDMQTDKIKKRKYKKIIIIVLLIAILFGLIFTAKNLIDTIFVARDYKAQIYAVKNIEKFRKANIEKKKKEEERLRKLRVPILTDVGKNNMASIYKSETKRAFLTFDDGPSIVTSSILDILKQENIKATFFVLGSRVEAMPEETKKIYEEGHYIANHGYSHVYSSIYKSPQSVLDEFNRCNDAVKSAIGVEEYNSHLFRFPGGLAGGPYATIKSEAKELLLQNNVLNVDWNALSGDAETTTPTVEFEMQRIQETVSGKNSVVILMHDAQAKKATAEALPQIISWLRENGYEFKNFYDIIK